MDDLHIETFGLTDRGRVRSNNEDQYLIADLSRSLQTLATSVDLPTQTRLLGRSQARLLLVADGVGGQRAGQRASQIAVQRMMRYVLDTSHWVFGAEEADESFIRDLTASLAYCHDAIQSEAEGSPEHRGMATTLTMAYVTGGGAYVVHAGDSRCYKSSRGKLEQITRDQTMAQHLIDEGAIEPGSQGAREWGNVVLSLLGGDVGLRPVVYKVALEAGDRLLLCTDGLTTHVDDAEIGSLLGSGGGAEQICQQLVSAANRSGGSDNVTVVAALLG